MTLASVSSAAPRVAAGVASPWLSAPSAAAPPPPRDEVQIGPPPAPARHPRCSLMQAAVTAFSLAMMMATGTAMAQTAVDPAAVGALAKAADAHKKDGSEDNGGDNGVPWYDPLQQRANDINDGLRGVRDGLDSFTTRANQRLNDNPLSRYHAQGEVAGYHWKFDPMAIRVAPYLTLRPNQAGLGVRSEASLLSASLEKESHAGEWTVTHGVRGDLFARREFGQGTRLSLRGFSKDNLDNRFFGPRLETFEQWRREPIQHWKMSIDVNAGVADDLSHSQNLIYARSLQRFDNDQVLRPWLGADSSLRVELEEGVQHNLHDGLTSPYYRFLGAADKPIHIHFKGKSHVVDLEVGAQLEGNRDRAVALHPEIRARVRW